jgi:Family of unknown function (DUF5723)
MAKNQHRFVCLLLAGIFFMLKSHAQQPIGLMNDHYLPATSVLFNPASVGSSPLRLDINVLSANAAAYNNAFYVNHLSLFSLFTKNTNELTVIYAKPDNIHFFSSTSIQGPSVTYKSGSYFFGITTQWRTGTSFISGKTTPKLDLANILDDTLYEFPSSKLAGMGWMQFGFTIGSTAKIPNGLRATWGLTINYLAGQEGIAISTSQPFNFLQHHDSVTYYNLKMDYGASEGFREDVPDGLTDFRLNGSGFSFNIGGSISNGGPLNEEWKLSFSIEDLGMLVFKHDIDRVTYLQDEATTISENDLSDVRNSQDVFSLIMGNAGVAQSGSLKISLPASWMVQGEVALPNQFFLNAVLVQRLTLSDRQVQKANMVAFTPEYETRKIAAGVPIVWNNYDQFQVGGYFRYESFMIGTNNLASLLIPSQWKGADVYLGIHIFLNKPNELPDLLKCSEL